MAAVATIETNETNDKRGKGAGPRTPSRGRGKLRYAALIDATERLLQDENPDMIGLRQIGQEADVPPASVYHFFPTKEAAFVALARRYLEGLLKIHRAPIDARLIGGWKDLAMIDMRRAMEFYNAHPPMNKILYGGYGGVEARNIDNINVVMMANAHYGRLDKLFHMPVMRNPENMFEIRMGILDAIWTISVRKHGYITEEYLVEAHTAAVAYSRLYLPEWLEPRPYLADAAKKGLTVTVPFDKGIDRGK